MLSENAHKILIDNGYSLNSRNQLITISNAKKPIGIYLLIFVILVICIPVLLILVHPVAALACGLISIIPAYSILKGTETPDSIIIDTLNKDIDLISFSGTKSKSLHFNQVEKVVIRSLQETHEASALNEDIASMVYYICFNIQSKSVDVLRFSDCTKEELILVKEELSDLIKQPA